MQNSGNTKTAMRESARLDVCLVLKNSKLSNSATQQLSNSATQQLSNNCVLKSIFILVCALLAQGCSIVAEITDLTEKKPDTIFQSKGQAREIVPASQQSVVTAQGYKVQSSFDYYKGPLMITTAGGYKAHTSVQAEIFKE